MSDYLITIIIMPVSEGAQAWADMRQRVQTLLIIFMYKGKIMDYNDCGSGTYVNISMDWRKWQMKFTEMGLGWNA